MNEIKYPFNPIVGTEEKVLQQSPNVGSVYFTSDTRKIYLDFDEMKAKVPMGGNIGLFYGTMKPDIVVDGQTEFEFTMNDIVSNKSIGSLIPNVDDLILNSDGCFYKVLEIQGEEPEIILITEKLTIAGTSSGGGSSSGPSEDSGDLTSFKVGQFQVPNRAILQGSPCLVSFVVKATDDLGDYQSGEVGTYELYVNRTPVASGPVKGISSGEVSDDLSSFEEEYINTIDIAPFLQLGKTAPILQIFDANGVQRVSRALPAITVSYAELKWDYKNTTLNEYIEGEKESIQLSWSITGSGLEKITYLEIGENGEPVEIGRGTDSEFKYTLNFNAFNMTHGAYQAKMWAVIKVGNDDIPIEPAYRNIIVADPTNNQTIISVCLFEKELTQYNTINIPIYIYNKDNINGTAQVELKENQALKDTWSNVSNLDPDPKKSTWYYTPTFSGDAIPLTVVSGNSEKTIMVSVSNIGVNISEKSEYAFKLKANELASNFNLQNWKIDGSLGLDFSDKFDWVNGGIDSEQDPEFGPRQFIRIKAGSTMTIKYPMWERLASVAGKHFKFIFKAENCRDYDAQVLSCKIDKKIVYVDKTVEYFMLTNKETELTYAKIARVNNGEIELDEMETETLNVDNKESRNKFNGTYVRFGDDVYQCAFVPFGEDPEDVYNTWYKVSVQDSFNGLLIRAQDASFRTNSETLNAQFYEDSYIELEIEVVKSSDKPYIKMWIDGIPCGYTSYEENDESFVIENENIVIGSDDCDVCVYLAKLYESDLNIKEHMDNFYFDAPNAEEMVRRYRRNDIMKDDIEKNGIKTEIDMFKLAAANPDCLVHHYIVPSMPTTKSTEKYPCSYKQYQGSDQAKYYAEGVMIKVQGTSSEKYVVSAANLDTNFNYTKNGNIPSGIIDGATQKKIDGWSMDGGTAIPIDFTCTKVNVASCENVNNMVNQEWYNLFQPYKSVLKCKKPNARDTMQFTPGVIFVTDKSTKTDDSTGVHNNVFADTMINGVSYANLDEKQRYPKMYSLGQMGNSKKNVHVFHDTDNDLECCVEVKDNQMPQQWMVNDTYNKNDIGEGEKLFEFRYPDGVKEASDRQIQAWNDFVSWMAHANPQPKYEKHEGVKTKADYDDFAINKKTFDKITTYKMNSDQSGFDITEYDSKLDTYYTMTSHEYGYTGLKLTQPPVKYGDVTLRGFRAENQKKSDGTLWQQSYEPLIDGCVVNTYNYENFVSRDEDGNMIADPSNYIASPDGFTHDTYEYRMAKMLHECEEHLVMDSVLYHYLFIERHCMIDNVAKNTFWSTEDCEHWSLIKDYDNDTADGNDNQGKFTRTYGMEPTDRLNRNAYVFNAHQSVWFNFCHGLQQALEYMYFQLENAMVTKDGKQFNVWDPEAYLNYCKKIQSSIPERVWIEDYYRKYFRPNEVYNDNMYNSMLEGGQKKYQRKQYEMYQNLYMNTKYDSGSLANDKILFRPTGEKLKSIKIPVEAYSDCYIYSDIGSQRAKVRAKRNQPTFISCPVDDLGNATMFIHPGSNITKLGSTEAKGQLGNFAPDQMSFAGAKKLREIVYAIEDAPTINEGITEGISFAGTPLLERAYLCNLSRYGKGLDMSECSSLSYLTTKDSTFTNVKIANNAPLATLRLQAPTSLTLKNLTELTDFKIFDSSRLKSLELENIDNRSPNISKTILEDSLKYVTSSNPSDYISYKITDVNWSIEEKTELSETNIFILDKLLNSDYTKPAYISGSYERLPYSAAFTGSISIDEDAYSGSNSLAFYNRYVVPSFTNLDIDFEATDSKLYDIIIYDGDGVPHWRKKAKPDTLITIDFLKNKNENGEFDGVGSPDGEFDIMNLYKSPGNDCNYDLAKTWKIYSNKRKTEDDSDYYIKDIVDSTGWPIGLTVGETDLHIYPTFTKTIRQYPVTVKMKDPQTQEVTVLVPQQNYNYGTEIGDIIPANLVPYVDSSNLGIYEAYDFKGYGPSERSTVPLSENTEITGETVLWAIFRLENDIRKVVHPEWFEEVETYNNQSTISSFSNIPLKFFPDGKKPSRPLDDGITIRIKTGLTLHGKITIPAKINDKFVYAIDGNFAQGNAQQITHVFFEKDNSRVESINSGAFSSNSVLKYFDFSQPTLKYIHGNAFASCFNLKFPESFGPNIFYVGQAAFVGAFNFASEPEPVLHIPGHITLMGAKAFSNLNLPKTAHFILGSKKQPLNLYWGEEEGNYGFTGYYNKSEINSIDKFSQNRSFAQTDYEYTIYTSQHTAGDNYLTPDSYPEYQLIDMVEREANFKKIDSNTHKFALTVHSVPEGKGED